MNLQSFNIHIIPIYRKVEGATPERWRKVRVYDKPIYFPGGIHGLGKVMAHRVGKRLDETSRKIEASRAIGQKMIPNDRIFHRNQLIHPRSLTVRPCKMVVGRLLSYWEG